MRYFTERKVYVYAVLALVVLLLLAGCGSGSSASSTQNASTDASPAVSLTANTNVTATTATSNTAIATLKHMPDGTANLNWDHTDHMLSVQLALTGLAPSSVHPAHIYEGTCDKQGKALYPLLNIVADTHGVANVTSKISVPVPNGVPANGWSLGILNGPGLASADQALSIVCGDIINHDTSLKSPQAVQVPLQSAPAISRGQSTSGVMHLSLGSDHTLHVQMTLTGLQPDTEHAAHIHTGSCASQGAVLYPLPVVKSDASGKATVTATIQKVSSIPSTGWYVNVHRGIDMSAQSSFDPVACGDVITQPQA